MAIRRTPILFLFGLATVLPDCGGFSGADLHYKPSADAEKLPANVQSQVADFLTKFFGTPDKPVAYKDHEIDSGLDPAKLQEAPKLFRINCMHCHGLSGDGAGPTAAFLQPRPRDFRQGKFKFKSTVQYEKPTRDDLKYVLSNGVHYTAMPSFGLYGEEFLQPLVEYVILLSMRGQVESFLVGDYIGDNATKDLTDPVEESEAKSYAASVFSSWKVKSDQIVSPKVPKPASSPESVARGRELFLKPGPAQCTSCHGEDGTGRGAKDMKDDWGFATKPADLTKGIYRGGGRPLDFYRRIYNGVAPGGMPSFGNQLTDDQIWDLVHYVQSLKQPGS